MAKHVIAIDTESVGVGPGGRKSAVAQVSLVNWNTGQIYNSYIRRQGITDYRTKFSGITPKILKTRGRRFPDVKREVLNFLGEDCILVGHSLHHDLRGLGIAPIFDIRDTSKYWRFKKANNWKTPGLAFLANRFLNKRIRRNGRHSCVEDAKTALELYKLVEREWEDGIRNSRRNRHYNEQSDSEYEDSDSEYDDSDSEYDDSDSEYDDSYSEYYSDSEPGPDDYGPFAHNNDFF